MAKMSDHTEIERYKTEKSQTISNRIGKNWKKKNGGEEEKKAMQLTIDN